MAEKTSPDTSESIIAKVVLSPNNDDPDLPMCRICFAGASCEQLLKPCNCRGSVQFVHRSCLERWLGSTAGGACELCRHQYDTLRTAKSFWDWIRQDSEARDDMIFDLLCFLFLLPLGLGIGWMCLDVVRFCRQTETFTFESTTLVSIAVLTLLLYVAVVVLCSWKHCLTWRRWRYFNCTVRVLDRREWPPDNEVPDVPVTPSHPLVT